jgi:IS30 family transposase
MARQYKHLSSEQRNFLQRGLNQGKRPGQLAQELGCDRSTIWRETQRGKAGNGYDAVKGSQEAHRRRRRGRLKLIQGSKLFGLMHIGLLTRWSPEQIAGRLKQAYPNNPELNVSHETIYAYIYAQPRGELRSTLIAALRHGHKKRLPRSRGNDRRGRLKDMVSIHERPTEVEGREMPGHWEGDLIKGAGNQSAVGTLVERTSRYVVLARVAGSDAESILEGFHRRLGRLPTSVLKTLTYDQGKEMARHEELARRLKIRIFFADPHSPWQRPTNENTNGLLRQYLPKGMDLSTVSQRRLTQIAALLNGRPRKCLNFLTPEEVMQQQIRDLSNFVALQT